MAARRRVLASAAPMTCAALALWVSFGSMAFAGADTSTVRVGLLPPVTWLGACLALALVLGAVLQPSPSRIAPLWLSAILLLPWLPFRLPAAAFLWSGPLRWWIWMAVGVALVAPGLGRWLWRRHRQLISRPSRAALAAGVVAAAAYGAGAWAVAPRLPVSDEPHYLIITQSLLSDRDLQVENNYQHLDYRAYFHAGTLRPAYVKRGTNGQIYSIHAPGLPVLIAPAFALFGYEGVKVMLLLASAAATSLAWLLAFRVTRDPAASWFAWAAVAFPAPFFFHTFAVYPDGPGAALILVGVLPLVDERWREPRRLLVVGAALAILPWLHTRFALGALALALVIAGRTLGAGNAFKRLAALGALPLVSAVAWFAFFQVIYGTPNPAAPYGGETQTAAANLLRGVPGLLFDEQFGLLPNAPVYACAISGLVLMIWRGNRRLAIEILVIAVPYAFTVAEFQMWWAGYSVAARFLVPITLVLAIPMASWFAGVRTMTTRLLGGAALLLTLAITASLASVDRGGVLFNLRDGAWQLGQWLSPVADVTTALPSLFQGGAPTAVLHAAAWIGAIGIVLAAGLWLERKGHHPSTLVVALGVLSAVAAMAVASFVWRDNGVQPIVASRGGIALLRQYDTDVRQIAIAYPPLHRLRGADVPKSLTLGTVEPATVPGRNPLVFLRHVPAGIYAVEGTALSAAAGTLRVSADRFTPPLAEWPVASLGPTWQRLVSVPVGLGTFRVDGDDAAKASIPRLTVRALDVPGIGTRPAGEAEASGAAGYGPGRIFAVLGHVYLESGGAWVGGSEHARLVVSTDEGAPIRLFLRNAAAQNTVTVASGTWREELQLRPGEERQLEVPAGARLGTPIDVIASSGARPMDSDPRSTDDRLLGCWLELRP